MSSRKKHGAKTMTGRVVGTTTTVIVARSVNGDWRGGIEVGGIEFFVKMILYYLHERVWYRFIDLGVISAESSVSLAEAE